MADCDADVRLAYCQRKGRFHSSGNVLDTIHRRKKALAAALRIDEVKRIRDLSARMKAYAQQAKDRAMLADADELRRRAARRLHEITRKQEETVGFNKGGATKGVGRRGMRDSKNPALPTFKEAGIDKNLAKEARKVIAKTVATNLRYMASRHKTIAKSGYREALRWAIL